VQVRLGERISLNLWDGVCLLLAFEELDLLFVFFGGFPGIERAEILTLACLRILLFGIEAILP